MHARSCTHATAYVFMDPRANASGRETYILMSVSSIVFLLTCQVFAEAVPHVISTTHGPLKELQLENSRVPRYMARAVKCEVLRELTRAPRHVTPRRAAPTTRPRHALSPLATPRMHRRVREVNSGA